MLLSSAHEHASQNQGITSGYSKAATITDCVAKYAMSKQLDRARDDCQPENELESNLVDRKADHRVLSDVLLSIKPVHLANMVSQKKNHEYRKYRLRDRVSRLCFYETSDGGKGRSAITYFSGVRAVFLILTVDTSFMSTFILVFRLCASISATTDRVTCCAQKRSGDHKLCPTCPWFRAN